MRATAAALVAVAGISILAQAPPPQAEPSQRPALRAGINAVRVDASVTDRQGHALSDLQQSDFEILEDNKRQTIESFKLVTIPAAANRPGEPSPSIRTIADEEREARRDDLRIVALFLDEYHVRKINGMSARDSLVRFIREDLGPNDLVAVMDVLTPLEAVSFTRDREAVVRTLGRFEGRKYDYALTNQFELAYAQCPPSVIERVRTQATLTAFKSLVSRMGSLSDSRKTIVLFSEGFTFNPLLPAGPLFPQRGDPNDPRCLSLQRAGSDALGELRDELRSLTLEATRSNTVIYSYDPRGLAAQEFGMDEKMSERADQQAVRATRETLQTLADDTDGRLIVKPNDLEQGLRQIPRASSTYYLMTYSSNTPADGKFHKISVRVNRRDVNVRARSGYWASSVTAAALPVVAKASPPAGVTAALAALAQPGGGRFVQSWAGAERDATGPTRVTFVWEPVDNSGDLQRPRSTPVQVSLLARREATTYFQGPVGTAPAIAPRVIFEAMPGPLQLVVTVRGSGGEVLDKEVQEFVVPDLSGTSLMLSTPVLLRARTQQEWDRVNQITDPVPSASREFRRIERLLVRFSVHGPTPSILKARLLDRGGAPITDLVINPAPTHKVEVPLMRLAPGDYVLELSASAEPGQQRFHWIAFRVKS